MASSSRGARNQAQYIANIVRHDISFGIGPAGTGKTYLAVAAAVDALERQEIRRILLTRPAVEGGGEARLPARGPLPEGGSLPAPPLRRPVRDAGLRAGGEADGAQHHRGGAARLYAREEEP